jgi:hypothetical protein
MRRQDGRRSDEEVREEDMFRSSRWGSKAGASGWPIALALALALTGCSGGDESIDSPTPCTDMEFAESHQTPSSGDVFLQDVATLYSTCSTIDVVVVVNDLTDIWTVGFDLTFPHTLVRYDSYTLGPLLQQGSPANPPFVQVNESAGSLQVTATRLPPDGDVNAVGQQVLISLRFTKLSVGADMIDFDLSGGSTVNDVIQDEFGNVRPANFGPSHGGLLTVPL